MNIYSLTKTKINLINKNKIMTLSNIPEIKFENTDTVKIQSEAVSLKQKLEESSDFYKIGFDAPDKVINEYQIGMLELVNATLNQSHENENQLSNSIMMSAIKDDLTIRSYNSLI
jgi:hypothetical protein